MIKTEDLRLNNLLQDQAGNLLRVDSIQNGESKAEGKGAYLGYVVVDRDKFPLANGWKAGGIPLTDEWAIKFGYECLVEMACDFSGSSVYKIEITTEDFKVMKVHEAQNLYNTITKGKELELIPEITISTDNFN